MKKHFVSVLFVLAVLAGIGSPAWAHCQVPCGIYGDETRFTLMLEHVATIEKSMTQITEIGQGDKPNANQLVRWVNNKDMHADELAEIVTYYFMAQRIKPAAADDKPAWARYVEHVTTLHQVLVHAMKAKQTTELSHCAELRRLITTFKKSYLAK